MASDTDAGWTDITLNPPRTINLLDLNYTNNPNFALETLGETSLAAGHYTQLRLVLVGNNGNNPTANWVILEGQDPNVFSNRIPLETPSAIRSGVKLIHQFTVQSGQRVDLLLDFDPCHSIVKTGNGTYKLKPVIKIIPFALNGIKGFVNTNLLGNHVVVSAQVKGEIVRATMPNTQTGEFFLAHLPGQPTPENYPTNYDVVITADGHATAIIATVPVHAAPNITTISTPIGLNASSTNNIAGTVTLEPTNDDATVIVAAKQSLVSGPTVTVKSLAATVLDLAPLEGDYSYNLMLLPTAAPSLYQYNATTKVITPDPTDQSTVAKMYTIQGSAQVGTTIYATQEPVPSPVDIITVPTQNFTLKTP